MSTRAHPDYAAAPTPDEWRLRLYVTDWTPRCVTAYRKLKKLCQDHVPGRCDIEVIDLLEDPAAARRDQIVAVPTLLKLAPKPQRVLIGDLTQTDQVLSALDLESAHRPPDDVAKIVFTPGAGPCPGVVYLGPADERRVPKLSETGGVDGQ